MEPAQRRGLTLVLPPLVGGKLVKKTQEDVEKPKAARPVKLKPLREVLLKLIAQFKKKDDYAFFLSPVDPGQVAGYADVIKHPMDFGTMERKVLANRYRSLEEFTDDFRLVISNATTFNPLDSLYHSEALRISAYGLDQISKASSTVIQYETDWNIDVVEDEIHAPEKADSDVGGHGHTGRSPSVQPQQQITGRRGQRSLQHRRNTLAPPLNAKPDGSAPQDQIIDGRLPGSLDGVGVFPPGSDLANMMVELKIKGKRHKNKKTRPRTEKNPSYCADGSLDYFALENPFSVLSSLVPDTPEKPLLVSLNSVPSSDDPEYRDQTNPLYLGLTRKRPFFSTPSLLPVTKKKQKQKHWTIARTSTTRGFKKDAVSDDKDGDQEEARLEREPTSVDWGCFPHLTGQTPEGSYKDVSSLYHGKTAGILRSPGTAQNAQEAEAYLKEVLYGGCVGLSVARSMWEYCTSYERDEQNDFKVKTVNLLTPGAMRSNGAKGEGGSLGMPLMEYVRREVINPLTGGLHEDLYQAGLSLTSAGRSPLVTSGGVPPANTNTIFTLLPHILGILNQEVDMVCSILSPNGNPARDEEPRQRSESQKFDDSGLTTIKGENDQTTSSPTNTNSPPPKANRSELELTSDVAEIQALLQYLLDYTGNGILEIDHRIRQAGKGAPKFSYEGNVNYAGDIESEELNSRNREDFALEANPDSVSMASARNQCDTSTNTPDDLALEQIRLRLLALATRAQDNTGVTSPKPTHVQPSASAPSP